MTDEEKMQEAKEALKDVSAEKLREWLMTMAASKSGTQYMGIVIDYDTLAEIIRERKEATKSE